MTGFFLGQMELGCFGLEVGVSIRLNYCSWCFTYWSSSCWLLVVGCGLLVVSSSSSSSCLPHLLEMPVA